MPAMTSPIQVFSLRFRMQVVQGLELEFAIVCTPKVLALRAALLCFQK